MEVVTNPENPNLCLLSQAAQCHRDVYGERWDVAQPHQEIQPYETVSPLLFPKPDQILLKDRLFL